MGGKKVFELVLELGHKSQPLKHKLANGYTHKWCVFVRGANGTKIEHCIERVVFHLHESFPDPQREITEPPFQVKETGYAGFEIPIYVYFKTSRDKTDLIKFDLDLMLLTNKPNSIIRQEKLKFYHPTKEFERSLKAAGANLLSKDKKERSDSPPAKKQKSCSLIPSKDMSNKQSGQQASTHSQDNHSHSSQSASLVSQNQVLPSSQTQQHHHKSNSFSKANHKSHNGSHNSHSHSNNNHNNVGNHHTINNNNSTSNSIFGNHNTSHHSNHQSNNQTTKQSSQQQTLLPKSKSSSRELMDVFGAPLVYNNNKSQKTSNGRDHSSENHGRDVPMAASNNRSPIPPVARQPSPQIATPKSHGHQSHSHHHKSSQHNHDHHHKKHHHHHSKIKQEPPAETLRTPPPPPPPAQAPAPKKTPQKESAPQAVAFIAQADLFQTMREKISSLTDTDRLQKIVDIIEESGEWFNLTRSKFEFDLKRLDKKTLSKIEKCLP